MVVQVWRAVGGQTSPARVFDPAKTVVQLAQGLVCRPDDRASLVTVAVGLNAVVKAKTGDISGSAAPAAARSVPCVGAIAQVAYAVGQLVLGRRLKAGLHRR